MSAASGSVLFLDAKGQGFSRNLAALRDELLVSHPELPLKYFFANLGEDDAALTRESRALLRELNHATGTANRVVSASDSEFVRGCSGPQGQRRVLLLSPRLNLVDATDMQGDPVAGYTDVIVPGAAFRAAAEARFPGSRVHAIGLPVFTELLSDAVRAHARAQLSTAAPGSAGRRVVVITGQRSPEQVFGESSVRELVESLPDDVFLVIDIPGVSSTLESEATDLAERVFVNDGVLGLFTVLALADTVLTSRFRDAVYFAATGRKLLLLNTRRNVGTLGDRLPDEYERLGIPDVSQLPSALAEPYGEDVRRRFQSAFAVPDPATSLSALVGELF